MIESRPDTPLDGLVVLDVTIAFAGPLASLVLAGLGATVIKVERPGSGDLSRTNPPYLGRGGASLTADAEDDLALPFINRCRGKLGITLDLRTSEGVALFEDLVREADVLVENYSTGMLDSMGIGFDAMARVNPRLIYCSVSGFGNTAAEGERKAFDLMIQALSGVMGATGDAGAPPMRQGIVVGDIMAPLMAVIGVLSALRERDRSGKGQHVDVSMLDALTSLVAAEHFDALEKCGIPSRTGNSLARMAPFGAYPTNDGWVAICAPSDPFMSLLADGMGAPELMDDARFASRSARTANRVELDARIEQWTRTLPTDDVVSRLTELGVPTAEVRTPGDAILDPRVRAREAVVPLRHPIHGATADAVGTGIPIRFSRSRAGFEGLDAPFLGQHNHVVFGELLGKDADTLDRLYREGII